MFAQVKDVKCVSSTRPLSIIAEQDGSVAELNKFSGCQRAISDINRDSASFQPGALNNDVKNKYTQPLGSDSTRTLKMAKGKRRNTPKQSAAPPAKSHQNHASKQPSATPSKSPENFHQQTSPSSNSEQPHGNPYVGSTVAVLESSPAKSSTRKDLHSYQGADFEQQVKCMTLTSPSNSDKKHAREHLGLGTDSAFAKLISNEELIPRVHSQTTAPVVGSGECQDNAVARNEAPLLARLSISRPASRFVAPVPDISSESWTPDFRNMQDKDNSTEQHVPQITITAADGSRCQTSMASSPAPDDDSICKIGSLIHSSSMLAQPSTSRTCGHAGGKRPKLFGNLSKIMDAECSGPPLEREEGSGRGSPNPEHSSTVHPSDFWRLKETTEKLHLSTRRPSTMLWKQRYIEGPGLPAGEWGQSGDAKDDNLSTDRKQRIDEALEWLRNELQEMRSQDQNLARQLLAIRQDIHQLKLQRSTEEHQEFLEDFQCELDDVQEFSDSLDLPKPTYGNNPLKHVGVTRLNISARRFSAC